MPYLMLHFAKYWTWGTNSYVVEEQWQGIASMFSWVPSAEHFMGHSWER